MSENKRKQTDRVEAVQILVVVEGDRMVLLRKAVRGEVTTECVNRKMYEETLPNCDRKRRRVSWSRRKQPSPGVFADICGPSGWTVWVKYLGEPSGWTV